MTEYQGDYYKILGLTSHATSAEIRQSWLRLISYWHPDRASHQAAEERAKELNRAYQVLSNPVSRADYDSWYQEQRFEDSNDDQHSDIPESKIAETVNGSGWEPPPSSYRHHSGIDHLTGLPRRVILDAKLLLSSLFWMAGLGLWLILLIGSFPLIGGNHSPLLQAAVIGIDVMALWTWIFSVTALFRSPGQRDWWRFWIAELLGALTATSVTLFLTSVGILVALLLSPNGLSTFDSLSWLGAGIGLLAVAGALGAFAFYWVWLHWQELVANRWKRRA